MAGRGPKGQGTVYKEASKDARRRDTSWRALKWVELPNGIRKRVSARGRTQEEALKKVDRRARELELANPSAEKITLSEYLQQWLQHKENTVKASSLAEYRRVLEMAADLIGHFPLAKVKPLHIQKAIDAPLSRGHYATAANTRRYLKQAFTQAVRWELLVRNPVANIPPIKRPPVERKVWQPHEIQFFLEANRGATTYFALFHTAVFTGMRRGELMALPWSNVRPTEVKVDRTYSRHAPKGWQSPKTRESTRTIPITDRVYEVIRQQHGSTWAFPSLEGTMVGERNLQRAFKEAIERTNMRIREWNEHLEAALDRELKPAERIDELPDMRIHDLRRTAATLWAMKGVTPKHIQKLLGHSTPHLALAVYTDVMHAQERMAALDLSDITGGRSSGRKTPREPGNRRENPRAPEAPTGATENEDFM